MDHTTRLLLKEDRLHGSAMLPLASYEVVCAPGEKGFDCHWHEEAEFLLVLEGQFLIQADTEYFTVRAGEAVFIDGGDIHAALDAGGSGGGASRLRAVVFDAAWLSGSGVDAVQKQCVAPLLERKKTFPRRIAPESAWERELLDRLRRIIDLAAGGYPGSEAMIKGYLLLMLGELSAGAGRACDRSEAMVADVTRIERLKTVILYMQQHYHRPIRLRELADQIPMSEGQFNRFFKSMTRTTPIEYLNAYRIKKAGEYLSLSDKKISAVAMDVGFDNLSYFIKVFRQSMKCTPSEFRRAHGRAVQRGR